MIKKLICFFALGCLTTHAAQYTGLSRYGGLAVHSHSPAALAKNKAERSAPKRLAVSASEPSGRTSSLPSLTVTVPSDSEVSSRAYFPPDLRSFTYKMPPDDAKQSSQIKTFQERARKYFEESAQSEEALDVLEAYNKKRDAFKLAAAGHDRTRGWSAETTKTLLADAQRLFTMSDEELVKEFADTSKCGACGARLKSDDNPSDFMRRCSYCRCAG